MPNYRVFDEKRYFTEGNECCLLQIDGLPVAVTVCEDIWHPQPMAQAGTPVLG
ncbi:hypothetical protein ULG90_10995 [Halopseudomonas pachastrellae]|nr:hypothetical protein ULG90_10995 [Halopseudomonas pachastrellae]